MVSMSECVGEAGRGEAEAHQGDRERHEEEPGRDRDAEEQGDEEEHPAVEEGRVTAQSTSARAMSSMFTGAATMAS
jgi:hypothetical protein